MQHTQEQETSEDETYYERVIDDNEVSPTGLTQPPSRTTSRNIFKTSTMLLRKYVLPKPYENEEDMLLLGPIAKLIKYRRIPFKLIQDFLVVIVVLILVLTIFQQKKKYVAVSTDSIVKTFLPDGYENIAENNDGYFTYFHKNIPDVIESMFVTVDKFYKLAESNVDIYELALPSAKTVGRLDKAQVALQNETFIVLTTKMRKADLRQELADEDQPVFGKTQIAEYGKSDAVHSVKGFKTYYEIINRTNPYGRYFNPSLSTEQLRYNFDRLLFAELEMSIKTLDLSNDFRNEKYSSPECVSWNIRMQYDFKIRTFLMPQRIKYNYGDCNVDGSLYASQRAAFLYFWCAIVLIISSIISFALMTKAVISRLYLWVKHRRAYGASKIPIKNIITIYIGLWPSITLLRDAFNIVGALMLLVFKDKDGTLISREVINIATDLFSGIGALFTCLNMVKYLQYNAKFYILILALQRGFPDVIRFLVGVFPLFIGYVLAGSMWFGHYVKTFESLDKSFEILFSSVFGDVLRFSFDAISGFNTFFKQLGRFYLVSFVMLYIYCVLNIFLLIFGEAYTNLKEQIQEGMRKEQAEKEENAQQKDSSSSSSESEDHILSPEARFVGEMKRIVAQKLEEKSGTLTKKQLRLIEELEATSLKLIQKSHDEDDDDE